jgi:chemotaxis protein MotA
MELAWIIGIVGGTVFLLISFWFGAGGTLLIYLDLMSFFTTVFGSFGALLIATPLERIRNFPRVLSVGMKPHPFEPLPMIEMLVHFAERARREGVLSLDDAQEEIGDVFLKKALRLVIDGTDPEVVKTVLFQEINQMETRHAQNRKMLDDWAYFAPAFGMIGTLQGLIAMLPNLSDKASIGRNMAIALITTLYGAVMANFLLLPMSSRLETYNRLDVLLREIVIEGVLSIQAGDNPVILREKLHSFIPPELRPERREAAEDAVFHSGE